MASGDTKTEAMLNVLGNGGSGDEFRGCCNTKTQQYILDAIDRINNIQPGGSYEAGTGIEIADNTISVDTDTIQPKLTAGTGIDITNNVISSTGGSSDVNEYVIKGAGAPTTSTVGTVGLIYEDTTSGKLYQMKSFSQETVYTDTYTSDNPSVLDVANQATFAAWAESTGMTEFNHAWMFIWHSEDEIWDVCDQDGVTFQPEESTAFLTSIGLTANPPANEDAFVTLTQGTTSVTTYTWEEVGGSITPVQTTGTSTTDVMSQNAVTGMVFADPATQEKIKIGAGTSTSEGSDGIEIGHLAGATGTNAVAIGRNAQANDYTGVIALGANSTVYGQGSIALGASSGSNASTQGVMYINAGNTAYGYNSTNYRLLTGLYDPQNAHDAATKGYVDGLVGNVASALNAINNGTSS